MSDPETLVDLLWSPARECPDETAIHLWRHDGPAERITFRNLWDTTRCVSRHLRHSGLRPGQRVLVILPTSRAFLETFFGVILAGGIPVPLAPPFSLSKLEAYEEAARSIMADSGVAVCVSLPSILQVMRAGLENHRPDLRILTPDPIARMMSASDLLEPDSDQTAFIQYTSGSTSQPKGVELTHANLMANVRAIHDALKTGPEDVAISWLPLHHDMGLIGMLFGALYARRPLVLMPPQAFMRDPMLWLRAIAEYRATITAAPNFAYDYSSKRARPEDVAGIRLDSLRVALNGAEPVDVEAIRRFQEAFRPCGLRENIVRPVYGLAESSLAVTFSDPGPLLLNTIDADRLEREALATPAIESSRKRTVVSVGRPIRTQEIRIEGANGETLADRHVGEVVVRGPSVMKGYFNRPEQNGETLRGGWLHTGDTGYLLEGRLFLTGRKKDIIIRHGRKYHPQDIEHVVAKLPGVLTGSVVAFGVENSEETSVVIVAETRSRDEAALVVLDREIREFVCRAFLFKPTHVHLVPPGTIPRTTSGKVRRQPCKQLYVQGTLGRRR